MKKVATGLADILCKSCLGDITIRGKACPWLSMDNEYCQEIRAIIQTQDDQEKAIKRFLKMKK